MHTDVALESIFRTGDGVFAVDDEQRILFWNQGAEDILGYTPEEVMGNRCFLLIQGFDELGQVNCVKDCPVINCARQGQLRSGQNLQVRARNGSLLWISATHTFVGPFDNHPAAVVHIFRDATPEVEAIRLLGRMAKELSGYDFLQGREERGYSPDTKLTEREKQVLVLLAQGEATSSIAKQLTISNTTAAE